MPRVLALALLAACAGLLFFALISPAPAQTVELLANPGFEQGRTSWTPQPATLVFDTVTAPVHGGSLAAFLSDSAPGYGLIRQDVPATPGLYYELSGWAIWNEAALANVKLRLQWLDGSGAPTGERLEAAAPLLSPDWQLLTIGPVAAPAGASVGRVECYTYISVGDPAQPALFDDMSLTAGPQPRPDLVVLNEFLPAPHDLHPSEWIELYNGGPTVIKLAGWTVRDAFGHSSALCADRIAPGQFLLCLGNFSLNNDGDTLTLVDAGGAVVDTISYGRTAYDVSWSRTIDGAGIWTDSYPPSPGAPNRPAASTPTPSVTPTGSATPTATPSLTPTPRPGPVWRFWGGVYRGSVGDITQPLAGAQLALYGYIRLDGPAQHLRSTVTGHDGWYGLITDRAFAYYVIEERDPPGFVSVGARSTGGGQVLDANRILFAEPTPGVYYLSNDFWDAAPEDLPSATATATPAGNPPLAGNVLINEVQYDAVQSGAETGYEWIEVLNRKDHAVDLAGWRVEDNNSSDFLDGPILPPHGLAVVVGKEGDFRQNFPGFQGLLVAVDDGRIGNGLANDGDRVILRAADGREIDAISYGDDGSAFDPPAIDVPPGHSLCRWPHAQDSDSAVDWIDCGESSPGEPNPLPPTATPSATPAVTATATPLPPFTGSPTPTPPTTPTPTVTPSPTVTPTSTVTPTPTAYPLGILLNEFLAAPRHVDWDGDGTADQYDEWIELYSSASQSVDLGGWVLDDEAGGSAPHVIPAGTLIEPGGFVVFSRRQTGLILNNDGDEVRLLGPDGVLLDRVAYDTAGYDVPWSRTVDGGGEWSMAYPPSPGGPNRPATPTATPTLTPTATPYPIGVLINEFLAAPRDVDWDGDGSSDEYDEWVELWNGTGLAVDLGGWLLDDAAEGTAASLSGSKAYVIPAGRVIEPEGFVLFFRRETRLTLNNDGDTVRLLGPDGAVLDAFTYDSSSGADVSWSRAGDGRPRWTRAYPPSPGCSNRPPPPTPTRRPPSPGLAQSAAIHVSLETARGYAAQTWVIVEGQVTAPPPLFGRSIYIQDHTGGMLVYLDDGEYPALSEGDWLRVRGRTSDSHGERRILVSSAEDLWPTGSGQPVRPLAVRSGEVDETHEGLLVEVFASAVRWGSADIILDDGSGEARVYIRESVGFERPRVVAGEVWSVVGIVSQYAVSRPFVGGYRLLPRYASDLSNGPLFLPVTGG